MNTYSRPRRRPVGIITIVTTALRKKNALDLDKKGRRTG